MCGGRVGGDVCVGSRADGGRGRGRGRGDKGVAQGLVGVGWGVRGIDVGGRADLAAACV